MALSITAAKLALRKAAQLAAADAGEHLLKASNANVPDETGHLQSTGKVSQEGAEVAVSYDAEYAVRVHEDLTDFHDDGTAKFLENAANAERDKIAQVVAGRIRKSLS